MARPRYSADNRPGDIGDVFRHRYCTYVQVLWRFGVNFQTRALSASALPAAASITLAADSPAARR